ncbi:MAG: hypothetical protein QGG50_03540 [Methanopyri archaeon]|jgi:hypothetical protein|nr:hypothetical protein [Methanopyri archaeon]
MTILAIYMVTISALAAQFMGHRNERRGEVLRQRAIDEADRIALAMNPYFALGRLNKTISCDNRTYSYRLKRADAGSVRFYIHVVYDTRMQYFGPYEAYAPLHFNPPDDYLTFERTVKIHCEGRAMYMCIDTREWGC